MNKFVTAFFALLVVVSAQQSICDKYAGALGITGTQLVTKVVGDTVNQFLNTSGPYNLKRFFDGSIANTVDFTNPANSAQFNALATHLVEFFQIALGCTGAPDYTGVPLTVAHKNLPLARSDWEKFNYAIISVLDDAGVTTQDQGAVLGVLESVKCDNEIAPGSSCNQSDCGCPVSSASSAIASFVTIAAAYLFLL